MKILETAYSGKNIAGGEIHLLYLVKALLKKGHEITVICPDQGDFSEMLQRTGAAVVIIPFKHSYDIAAFFKILLFIIKNKFDIVHTHGLMLNTLVRAAAIIAMKPKIFSTVHLIQKLHDIKKLSVSLKIKFLLFRVLDNFFSDHTRRIIAVSNAVAQDLIVQGIDYRKIETIHNGIELELFSEVSEDRRDELKEKYNIKNHSKIIGIAGRIAPLKGHITFVEAAKKLQEKYEDLYVIIAGEDISGGYFKKEVEDRIKELELNNVIFTGFVKNISEIASLFDIWCVPSWHEPFGLVVTEAMAMKIPVVATRSGGIPEIIKNDHSGVLVSPKNSDELVSACEKIFSDEQFKENIIKNAFDVVKRNFSIEKMVKNAEQ